jgi:hypothetical protein
MTVLVTLLVLSAPGLGQADTKRDPAGDLAFEPDSGSRADLDLLSVTSGTAKRGQAVQTVTVAGRAADPKGKGILPTLWVDSPTYPNARSECDFYVGKMGSKIGVFKCGTTRRIGSAKVVRTSASTLRYSFSRKTIGKPKSYRWSFFMWGPKGGTTVAFDRLPDVQDGTYTNKLR